MRLFLIACLVLVCTEAQAGTDTPPTSVTACDSLITLRRLMMQGPESGPIPAEFVGCRDIPSRQVGDVEKRAMIGDAPFECRAIEGGSCLWIRP